MIDWLPGVFQSHSPNHGDRGDLRPELIVLHYTGGPSKRSDQIWCGMAESKVSYHLHIARNGDLSQMVPLDRAAYHAGVSEVVLNGEARNYVNSRSIGIGISNLGLLVTNEQEHFYRIGDGVFRYSSRFPPARYGKIAFDHGLKVDGWWEPYSARSLNTLERAIDLIYEEFGPLPCVGHEDIAMPLGRKCDPGALFPWEDLPLPRLNPRTRLAGLERSR